MPFMKVCNSIDYQKNHESAGNFFKTIALCKYMCKNKTQKL